MQKLKRTLTNGAPVLVLAVLALGSEMKAAIFEIQSGPTQSALLELYSSEGCSSCPPAEEWLSRLKDDAGLWKQFVPVCFHVDYWDSLGWKDSFGSKRWTERQHALAARWKSDSVYTPGFVLNGSEWRGWFRRETLPKPSNGKVGVLSAGLDDHHRWSMAFTSATGKPRNCEFHAAILGFDLQSDVKVGENRGRRLVHDFVVLDYASAPGAEHAGVFNANLSLQLSQQARRLAIAVWVTLDGQPEPRQAAGGWLPVPK